MENKLTPAERAARMTPEERKKVLWTYRVFAILEAIVLVVTVVLVISYFLKAKECKDLWENWTVGSSYSTVEMMHQEDAMMQNAERSAFAGAAVVLVLFGIWSALSPNNRESIFWAVRRVEKAEKNAARQPGRERQ